MQKSLILALVATLSVSPMEALAFEETLAAAPQLVAVVEFVETTEATIALRPAMPAYSYRNSGSVMAYPSPETVAGVWPKQQKQPVRLALASVPASTAGTPMVLEGEASYYSRAGCLGCSPSLTMANGQPLNDNALTMAIGANLKHLVGRTATVQSLATGKEVTVLITDTGGFYQSKYGNRVADLTVATKQAIGMAGGVGQVRVTVH